MGGGATRREEPVKACAWGRYDRETGRRDWAETGGRPILGGGRSADGRSSSNQVSALNLHNRPWICRILHQNQNVRISYLQKCRDTSKYRVCKRRIRAASHKTPDDDYVKQALWLSSTLCIAVFRGTSAFLFAVKWAIQISFINLHILIYICIFIHTHSRITVGETHFRAYAPARHDRCPALRRSTLAAVGRIYAGMPTSSGVGCGCGRRLGDLGFRRRTPARGGPRARVAPATPPAAPGSGGRIR